MNRARLLALGGLYLVIVVSGLILVESVNVAPDQARAALTRGGVQVALAALLLALLVLGAGMTGLLAVAVALLSAAFLVGGWSAVRAEAFAPRLITLVLFTAGLLSLLVHLVRARRARHTRTVP